MKTQTSRLNSNYKPKHASHTLPMMPEGLSLEMGLYVQLP